MKQITSKDYVHIQAIAVEINHRFNKDTELLTAMLPFDEEAWQESIPIVAAQLGFDRGRLCNEGKTSKDTAKITKLYLI